MENHNSDSNIIIVGDELDVPGCTEKTTSENDSEPSQKRKRIQTDFYGQREDDKNDDSIFDKVEEEINTSKNQSDTLQTVAEIESNIVSQDSASKSPLDCNPVPLVMNLSPFERILLDRLIDIQSDMAILKKQMLEINVKMCEKFTENTEIRVVDDKKLLALGLPLNSAEHLDNFEKNLLEEEFCKQVVSLLFLKS